MEKINISNNTLIKLNRNNKILQYIQNHRFEKAYSLILEDSDDANIRKYVKKLISEAMSYVDTIFETNDIENAKIILNEFTKNFICQYKTQITDYYNKQLNFYISQNKLKKILVSYNFDDADNMAVNLSEFISREQYELLKSKYVQLYFEKIQKININDEQALALAKSAQNLLVTARAGSGKTRTIACKAIYSIEKGNCCPDEILILAFNKKAKQEIVERITKNFKYNYFNKECARTFHSLAYRIAGHTDEGIEDILFDDTNRFAQKKLTNFIEKLYHSEKIWNQDFKDKLYYFYKADDDIAFDDEYWNFDSLKDKYNYLKKRTHYTLNGEKVKSNGEKYIANFLFEHNIKYSYEKLLLQKNHKLYRPDFTILQDDKICILEHWGIDEEDISKSVPQYWDKSWDDYHKEMQWKRELLNLKIQENKITDFIETSIVNLKCGEISFEKYLKNIFEMHGIKCVKLSHDEILNKMETNGRFDKMAQKFAQFILAAKKAKISPDELDSNAQKLNLSQRTMIFLELVNKIYREYENELHKQHKTDFDNIFEQAIKNVINKKGNIEIKLGKSVVNLKNIKLLMIDEYQDFSKLFFELVMAIKKYNPGLKLFCVGDDWQAINGFAGSDLKYFENFTKLFENSDVTALTYNYRSGEEIVSLGNKIMKDKGIAAKCFNTDIDSKLFSCQINKVEWVIEEDSKYMYDSLDKMFFDLNHRYLKKCVEIISDNPDKSFIILHRMNTLCHYHNLDKFQNTLKVILNINNINSNVEVNTIHSFKGCEADNVIFLEPNIIPLVHPDNEFYFVLGRTPQMVLDEERRLFYVAVTRAKENIYFLFERN